MAKVQVRQVGKARFDADTKQRIVELEDCFGQKFLSQANLLTTDPEQRLNEDVQLMLNNAQIFYDALTKAGEDPETHMKWGSPKAPACPDCERVW